MTMKKRPLGVATFQPDVVVEVVIGKHEIGHVIEKRLRGEHTDIGDFDDAFHIRQESHAMLLATTHRACLQSGSNPFRIQCATSVLDEPAQGTYFFVD